MRFYTVVTDQLGTPTDLVGADGTIAWHSRATLWGLTAEPPSSGGTPLRFPGQYFDPETGLHYNFLRCYDPETGRYLSQDPLGLIASPNPATYVTNPHRWMDPLGLAPCRPAPRSDASQLMKAGRKWYFDIKFPDRGALIGQHGTPAAARVNRVVALSNLVLARVTRVTGHGRFQVKGSPFPFARHDPVITHIRPTGTGVRPRRYNGPGGIGNTIAALPDGGKALAAELARFGRGEIASSQISNHAGREFATIAYFAETARGYSFDVLNLPSTLRQISRMSVQDARAEWQNIQGWFTPAERGDRAWRPGVDV